MTVKLSLRSIYYLEILSLVSTFPDSTKPFVGFRRYNNNNKLMFKCCFMKYYYNQKL